MRKLVARGGFVEDKLSQKLVSDVREKGFKDGWEEYGCYLVDDHAGVPFTGHIDGGNFLTEEAKLVADRRPCSTTPPPPNPIRYSKKGNFTVSLQKPKQSCSPLSLKQSHDVILASSSPRRRELMKMLSPYLSFTCSTSPFDEGSIRHLKGGMEPSDYVALSAGNKAKGFVDVMSGDSRRQRPYVVIGADTVVECGGAIMEKPRDKDEARQMLRKLSGTTHNIMTGINVIVSDGPDTNFVEVTKVTFDELTEDDVEGYVDTGEPMDKAGGYGIQGIGGQFVKGIEGGYFSAVGLPVGRLSKILRGILK